MPPSPAAKSAPRTGTDAAKVAALQRQVDALPRVAAPLPLPPRDICEAIQMGMSNEQIHGWIRAGALHMERSGAVFRRWPSAVIVAAQLRDLMVRE